MIASALAPNVIPDAEVTAALEEIGGEYAQIADQVTVPWDQDVVRQLEPTAVTDARAWLARCIRKPYVLAPSKAFRAFPKADRDLFVYEGASATEAWRYVDINGAALMVVKPALPEALPTREVARDRLVSWIGQVTLHPNPAGSSVADYLQSRALPSGRTLWYGNVTLGETLAADGRVLSPHDWYRRFRCVTDGRSFIFKWVFVDSTLPKSTGGTKQAGTIGRRIVG
jgi:hypothetical protein